jgi:aminobenzoyl-glutamate transport protein
MNQSSVINRVLLSIEKAGNALPHPTILFILLCALILVISAITGAFGVSAVHPISGDTITGVNLISKQGLHLILTKTVTNFTHFAPVGSVLVAILGIGVAEHSGLISAALRATVLQAPRQLLSFFVVLTGVLSSIAMDTGYVVLIPLAAMLFVSVGRHPLAGMAAAFAGVSGGFSANLLIGPVDAILAGISSEAAALVQPGYTVSATGNYYFLLASTLLISVVGTVVTEKVVAPRLGDYQDPQQNADDNTLTAQEKRGLKATATFTVLFVAILLYGILPAQGFLRLENGDILSSPFIKGIVTIIAFYAAVSGYIYGRTSGSINRNEDFIKGMENSMSTMAGYLVLMFFAAQFVSYFSWSQLGAIAAINGAELLQSLDINNSSLLLGFIIMAALINLLIGSASAKWALFAPVFVPMFLLLGISPEATQIAYRIGDSTTNIITPLMPYFGIIIAFAQRYDKGVGIGTIIATMLPYSIALLASWSALLVIWILMDWPLGPGAAIFLTEK